MKAIVQGRFGSPAEVLQLSDVETPVPADDEVLVRIHTASIHIGDYYTIAGLPKAMRPVFVGMRAKNRVPGTDFAGTIEAVGDGVDSYRPGDEVFGSYKGAFAEAAVAPVDAIAPKPTNLSFEQASTLGVSAVTALQGIRDQGKVQAGQRVLVTGASGGVGSFAVQIAKAFGAEVTGVCSTRNADRVRAMGADHVVDYTRVDFTEEDERYDFIFDNVAARSRSATRRALSPTGTLLTNSSPVGGWFGGIGAPLATLVSSLFHRKQGRPFVSKMSPKDLAELRDLAEAGKLVPALDTAYPLDRTPDAVAHVGEGHAQGKTTIEIL
jgi:NADPH:quinone reductase-like Zn-dependent oxidoreductase